MVDNVQSKIHQWVTSHAEQILHLTETLMRFPSVNHPPTGDEFAAQQFVIETMREMNLDTDVFLPTDVPELAAHPAFWKGRDYTNRPNVVGTWRGAGDGKSLLFSSHIDVVAGSPGGRFENFVPTREGDKLYGRGSNDMKGGLAATLMAVQCLQDIGVRLNGNVIVESVVDEENGGANGTLASRLRRHKADACIVPEPTGMVVAPAHKGGRIWDIRLKGSPGIGFSADNIVSPIYGMARLVTALQDWEEIRNRVTPPHPQFVEIPGLPVLITKILAGEFEPGAGDAVPENAMMEIWCEEYPGTSEAEHYQRLIGYLEQVARDQPSVAKCKMTIEPVTRFLPGSEIPRDHPIVQTVSHAFAQTTNHTPVVRGAPFACDVFVFNQIANVPCVILGPRGGNAHSYDEWVIMQDLVDLTEIFARTAVEWGGVA
jgi:acetylornithine deacetylase